MQEQLYFTWSTVGLGDVPGLRVRAASPGVSDINGELYNSFKPYLNYNLPQGIDSYAVDAALDRTPISLIFADTGKERVILQKVYKGKDKYNRPGVYFAHLLAGLPQDFLARDAIDLWKSRSWVTGVTDEQSVKLLPVDLDSFKRWPGMLSERDIANVQQYLPLLIQAYLTIETQKIYIAAPNSQVAALIWGLAHSLPRILQQTLTFSTYEQDVTKSALRIACTSTPDEDLFLKGYARSAQILPAECFTGKGIAIDCYSGKTSDLKYVSQEVVDYSLYATNCLIQGRKKELDDLLTTADRLETKSTNEFLAVCKFYTSLAGNKALTKQEVTGLLSNKKLVTALLHQEKVQHAIIDLAIADPQWWDEQAAPILIKLRPNFATTDKRTNEEINALTAFGVQAAQTLYATMLHNQTRSSEVLMRVLNAITPPDRDVTPWIKLLQSFSEYIAQDKQFHPAKAFAWEFRAWLLQRWAYGYQEISDGMILPWLQLNWNDFTNLLALPDVPEKWRQLALMQLLSRSTEPLPKESVKLFNNPKYQPLCLGALKELMRFAQTQPAASRCFKKLVEYGYGDKISLLIWLLDVRTASKKDILTPEMLDEFLHAARMKDKEKVELLEQNSSLLLGAGHQNLAPALVDVITVYVTSLPTDKLLDKSAQVTLKTLDLLGKQVDKLPANLADHIKVWLCVSYGVVRDPFVPLPLEKKFLTAMGKYIVHFKLQSNKKYRESFFTVLINSIRTIDELHLILEVFKGPLEKRSQKELLYDLSAFIGERYNSTLPHQLLLPYIEAALEYASFMKSPDDREDFLAPLFKALLRNINSEIFQKIQRTIPKGYQGNWLAYAVPPESRSLLQKVSDVGGNVIGGVVEGVKAIGGGKESENDRSPSRPLTNEPNTSQGEPPPQNRNGQGSGQNQQNMQQGNQRPQSNAIQQNMGYRSPANNQQNVGYPQERTTPKYPYNPDDYQQQGGQAYPSPAQPQYGTPAQQYQQSVYEQTQMSSSVQPVDTSSQDQFVSPNAQMYNVGSQPEPQSTVNGQPIYPKWIVTVYKLKGPYIEYRDSELKKELTSHQKKKLSTDWILDEQSLLRNLLDVANTLKLLEMDIIVHSSLLHYLAEAGHLQLDPQSVLEKVYKDLQGKYKGFSEEEVKNVLFVFVRYRVLSEYFRKQNPPVRLRHWLDKQWLAAEDQGKILRSPNPLPDGK